MNLRTILLLRNVAEKGAHISVLFFVVVVVLF